MGGRFQSFLPQNTYPAVAGGLSYICQIEVSYTSPFPGEPTGQNNHELLRMQSSH